MGPVDAVVTEAVEILWLKKAQNLRRRRGLR